MSGQSIMSHPSILNPTAAPAALRSSLVLLPTTSASSRRTLVRIIIVHSLRIVLAAARLFLRRAHLAGSFALFFASCSYYVLALLLYTDDDVLR